MLVQRKKINWHLFAVSIMPFRRMLAPLQRPYSTFIPYVIEKSVSALAPPYASRVLITGS